MSYLTSLFIDANDPNLFLYGSYNPWLVALSLLIAIFASGMALQVAGMARLSDNPMYRQVALITGSLALGAEFGRCTSSACWLSSCARGWITRLV